MAELVVSSIGMLTAVGLSAAETWCSVRSATARFSETSILDHRAEPITLALVDARALDKVSPVGDDHPLTAREARIVRLARPALRECLSTIGASAAAISLVLAVPESPSDRPLDGKRVLARLVSDCGGAIALDRSTVVAGGRAAGLAAVSVARDLIRSGKAEMVIVGGADTYRDLYLLATLDAERRVRSAAALDGFIPGEGAAFVLLVRPDIASARGYPTFAGIAGLAEGFETGHLYSTEPYRGDGLASTFRQLVAEAPPATPIRAVFSSMNGESHWGKEWGVGFIRNRDAFDPDLEITHPADAFGDVGTAAGPVLLGLASLAVRDGRATPPVLVFCCSDRGQRAALTLVRPT
jgi:3-oxoacyl-[acyl-carrier-protein] synthase I